MANRYIQEIDPPSTFETRLKSGIIEKTPLLKLPRNRSLKKLLREAIDNGLSSLGDSAKEAVYFYLERTFSIEKLDIPNKIGEFANAIEEIFGLGAKILEIDIIKCLYEKVGYDFKYFPENDNLLFTKYVEAAYLYQENYFR